MKIVRIFADKLFSFHYENEEDNEYDRLMDLWTDVGFLKAFALKNYVQEVYQFIQDRLQDAEEVQDFLEQIVQDNQPFEFYFEPLQDSERLKLLAFQKGKIRKNLLRLYAIKLEDDCFIITGGAIKMSQKMQEHPDTNKELLKLKAARSFLNENGVFDEDSFFELLIEQS